MESFSSKQHNEAYFTKFNNDLLETLISQGLSGTALCCFLFILRKTGGFHKDNDAISNSQFQKALNRDKNSIIRALNELKQRNIVHLLRKGGEKGQCNIWSLNKDASTWVLSKKGSRVLKMSPSLKVKARSIKNDKKGISELSLTKYKENKSKEIPTVNFHTEPIKQERDDLYKIVSQLCTDAGLFFECKNNVSWNSLVEEYYDEDIKQKIKEACIWMLEKKPEIKSLNITTLQKFLSYLKKKEKLSHDEIVKDFMNANSK